MSNSFIHIKIGDKVIYGNYKIVKILDIIIKPSLGAFPGLMTIIKAEDSKGKIITAYPEKFRIIEKEIYTEFYPEFYSKKEK